MNATYRLENLLPWEQDIWMGLSSGPVSLKIWQNQPLSCLGNSMHTKHTSVPLTIQVPLVSFVRRRRIWRWSSLIYWVMCRVMCICTAQWNYSSGHVGKILPVVCMAHSALFWRAPRYFETSRDFWLCGGFF